MEVIKISIYFCQACQHYKDNDVCPIHHHEDGQCCEDCLMGRTKEKEMEALLKQVDGNSVEIFEMDKRLTNLEEKQ